MKVLVTGGAAGFIGNAVCKRLINRGNIVIGLDNIIPDCTPDSLQIQGGHIVLNNDIYNG